MESDEDKVTDAAHVVVLLSGSISNRETERKNGDKISVIEKKGL